MARPSFQISLRYILLTVVPTVAAISYLARDCRAWLAPVLAYSLLGVLAVAYRRSRPA